MNRFSIGEVSKCIDSDGYAYLPRYLTAAEAEIARKEVSFLKLDDVHNAYNPNIEHRGYEEGYPPHSFRRYKYGFCENGTLYNQSDSMPLTGLRDQAVWLQEKIFDELNIERRGNSLLNSLYVTLYTERDFVPMHRDYAEFEDLTFIWTISRHEEDSKVPLAQFTVEVADGDIVYDTFCRDLFILRGANWRCAEDSRPRHGVSRPSRHRISVAWRSVKLSTG